MAGHAGSSGGEGKAFFVRESLQVVDQSELVSLSVGGFEVPREMITDGFVLTRSFLESADLSPGTVPTVIDTVVAVRGC